jgi:OOP family OmpA-OmpF porin
MPQARIKKGPIIGLVVVGALVGGLIFARNNGLLGPSSAGPSSVPVAATLPDVPASPAAPTAGVTAVPLPTKQKAFINAPEIRFQQMAWNSQTGLNFANGGTYTTKGSLMEKHKVNLRVVWEDDVMKQGTALINFAEALKGGNPQPTEGAHFMAVMGDGTAATIGSILGDLKKLGMDPEVIGSAGYSRGEDQLMGPPSWKANPKLARGGLNPDGSGGLISGFLRDGDWNIALKWAGDNGIKNNPDEKTWDPDAINWYSADDYIKAADAYINGVCEDRPVVVNGKRTGDTKHVCVNAVVTWTPGDVNVAEQKGGLATIVSTKEYRSQMPNTIIGIKQWNQANFDYVVEFLAAMFEGGDQVKAYPQALSRGCEANAEIWGNQKPGAYWEKYFKGVQTNDKQGVPVSLGGSSVNNLQDNLILYGLADGSQNLFAATYTVFADVVKQQYPKMVPDILPVGDVLNTSYVVAVQKKYGTQPQTKPDLPTFTAATEIKNVVSKKAWDIHFETGKATFTQDTLAQLNELKMGLLIAGDLAIEIHGHTDNTGDAGRNQALSQARATAVKAWLMSQGSTDFNADRFSKVQGHGSNVPVATNDTDTGRAKNRRVEVVMGSY